MSASAFASDPAGTGSPGGTKPGCRPRIAVLGGGVLGVSTAVHLVRRGASVVLVTEDAVASGASGRSLSWLNSAGPKSEAYHHLRMAGIDRYRTLLAQHPGIEWLGFGGGLHWAGGGGGAGGGGEAGGDAGEEAQLRERHDAETAHAYHSLLLEPEDQRALADLEPAVDAAAVTGPVLANPGEGWVSLPHLIDHLLAEFRARGGELREHAGRAAVVVKDGRAAGLRLPAGGIAAGDHTSGEHPDAFHESIIAADAVLVAAGPDTPALVADLGVHLPDASDPAMLLITEPVQTSLASVLNTPRVSVRPHPGGRLAMDHTWYLDRITRDASGSYAVDPAVVHELAAEAAAILTGHPELQPAEWKIGLKPVPGDGLPVLGELESVPGCFVAFTHSGATLGLIAGELLAGEMLTGKRHPMLAEFRAERFG